MKKERPTLIYPGVFRSETIDFNGRIPRQKPTNLNSNRAAESLQGYCGKSSAKTRKNTQFAMQKNGWSQEVGRRYAEVNDGDEIYIFGK